MIRPTVSSGRVYQCVYVLFELMVLLFKCRQGQTSVTVGKFNRKMVSYPHVANYLKIYSEKSFSEVRRQGGIMGRSIETRPNPVVNTG